MYEFVDTDAVQERLNDIEGITDVSAIYDYDENMIRIRFKSAKDYDIQKINVRLQDDLDPDLYESTIDHIDMLIRDYVDKAEVISKLKESYDNIYLVPLPIKDVKDGYLYEQYGDIALTVCEIHDIWNGAVKSYISADTKELRDHLLKTAFENSIVYYNPKIAPLKKIVNNEDILFTSKDSAFVYILSEDFPDKVAEDECYVIAKNERGDLRDGSVAIFLPIIAKKIADWLNDDFYICFTSKHEAIIHPKKKIDDDEYPITVRDLLFNLNTVIAETTPPEDFLSGSIFEYRRDTDKIEMMEIDEDSKDFSSI